MTKQLEALLAEMKVAAEKATPGLWEMEHENIWFTDADGCTKHLAYLYQGDDVDDGQDNDNTKFFALANPANVLALIAALEQSQREQDMLTDQFAVNISKEHDKRTLAEKRIAELEASKLAMRLPGKMSPKMMRDVQMKSALGAYAASHLAGAYDLFQEFWDVALRADGITVQGDE